MPSQNSNVLNWFFAVTCVCALTLVGCSDTSVKAANPAPVVPAPAVADSKPITNVAPDTTALPPVASATPPVTNTPPPATSLPVTPAHTKPAPPPRKPAPEPASETASEQNSKPAPPQILPQLSAGDQLAYQRQTEEDIKAAESNLQQASGKQLSAAQSDLVQKIQSFLSDSRAASKEGDWSRAQQLSQKARRVSDELVASF
ncbi:MAG: hypothetical protein WA823_07530 [Candidatus Acidiferrales bacterium]